MTPDTFTIAQAAAVLGRSEHVIRRWIHDGDLPATHDGRRLRIVAAAVRELRHYITVADAAQLAGVSRTAIYDAIRSGRLPVRTLNGRWYVQRADAKRMKRKRAKV